MQFGGGLTPSNSLDICVLANVVALPKRKQLKKLRPKRRNKNSEASDP